MTRRSWTASQVGGTPWDTPPMPISAGQGSVGTPGTPGTPFGAHTRPVTPSRARCQLGPRRPCLVRAAIRAARGSLFRLCPSLIKASCRLPSLTIYAGERAKGVY
jgi:hypothetical protein